MKTFRLLMLIVLSQPLVGVADDPLVEKPNPIAKQAVSPIQMLVPGFSVRELPVELPNINNVRYRADGKMVALGYNGDIWFLTDTDDDGFEDTAQLFFDSEGRLRGPIGMAVLPDGHQLLKPSELETSNPGRPAGVVVASKGKVSAILDLDGDGVAEEERVIASGWKEIPPNVDAIGVAIDASGAIYFGLGTAAYNNAYLIDDAGESQYDLGSERGTILRIEPDLSSRSIVCTGVRFTIGMEFDEHGDLFATDQEGATWLPNGNPFDELLHIRTNHSGDKQHFGFPPNHPQHLPDVFDEPSVFDYAPQHQSTCGMAFNLPRKFSLSEGEGDSQSHSALFGPAAWRGNLFVTGESRGKLYRTELVRTNREQYVARNHLIACLSMLTVDCCLSPRGDLVVACHSGGPDWGTGPTGQGRLLVIRYDDPAAPQPIATWAAGPQEVRVAFDKPLDPSQLRKLSEKISISYGQFVAAGDRFETIRPGYKAVEQQREASRETLPVLGVSVTPDRRTLIIATVPHRTAVQYAITLPAMSTPPESMDDENGFTQQPQIDLAYSLSGVLAMWEPDDPTQNSWTGVLPHFDLDVCRAFSTSDPDEFHTFLKQEGTLTLRSQLDLRDLLHPAIQPGSELDHTWPDEPIYVDGFGEVTKTFASVRDMLPRITLQLRTGERVGKPHSIGWRRSVDELVAREFPLNRFLLPWVEAMPTKVAPLPERDIPELLGGSWGRGRKVFHSDEAACAKCHVADGNGGAIGPDLTNLIHRDYTSVLRDVTQPSYAINPDYLASAVLLQDGRILTGAVRTDGEKLLVGDKDGKVHEVARDDVLELKHSPLSIMPEGIPQRLGSDRMRDLLTFLLSERPQMPSDLKPAFAKLRTRSEVAKAMKNSDPLDGVTRPLRILLVAGPKDHGPGEHDYPAWLKMWSELMRCAPAVTIDTADPWPSPEQFAAADTIAFFQKGRWNTERAQAIDAHLSRGRGLVYIHWAIEGGEDAPEFAKRIGLAGNSEITKYRHGPLDLTFQSQGNGTGNEHSVGRNFVDVHFHDESYWQLQGDPSKLRVIASGVEDNEPRPLFWTFEPTSLMSKQRESDQPGRVFVSILGHYSWTFDDPLFRILLLRGIAWSAGEPVDRFNELATIGVKLAD